MSDSGSGNDDEWEVEYRRSLDDDISDASDEDSERDEAPHSPANRGDKSTTDAEASAPVVSPSSSRAAAATGNGESAVLQALDEVWAQLQWQRSSCTVPAAWTERLDKEDAHTSSLTVASCDTLQRRLRQERARDVFGATVPSRTPLVTERWLVCQLLLLYQRLDSQTRNQ